MFCGICFFKISQINVFISNDGISGTIKSSRRGIICYNQNYYVINTQVYIYEKNK